MKSKKMLAGSARSESSSTSGNLCKKVNSTFWTLGMARLLTGFAEALCASQGI